MEPTSQNTRSSVARSYSWVIGVVITSDNKYIISGGADTTLRIWQEAVLQDHTDCGRSETTISDNNYIVSGGNDETVRIWNRQDTTQETVFPGHTCLVWSIAITSDNNLYCFWWS